jgi:hypothetical protein
MARAAENVGGSEGSGEGEAVCGVGDDAPGFPSSSGDPPHVVVARASVRRTADVLPGMLRRLATTLFT